MPPQEVKKHLEMIEWKVQETQRVPWCFSVKTGVKNFGQSLHFLPSCFFRNSLIQHIPTSFTFRGLASVGFQTKDWSLIQRLIQLTCLVLDLIALASGTLAIVRLVMYWESYDSWRIKT